MIASVVMLGLHKFENYIGIVIFSCIIFCEIFIINHKSLKTKTKFISLLAIGFILRLLWILNVKSVPVSDFEIMYEGAHQLLEGNTSIFHGTEYIARFPHLTIMVLYMALIIKIFPNNNLIAMKGINLILGLVTIYFVYKLAKEIFN